MPKVQKLNSQRNRWLADQLARPDCNRSIWWLYTWRSGWFKFKSTHTQVLSSSAKWFLAGALNTSYVSDLWGRKKTQKNKTLIPLSAFMSHLARSWVATLECFYCPGVMCLHFIVALVKFPPLSPGCDRSAPICPPPGGASVVAPLGLYLTFAARASTTAALRASCKKRSFF